ncbi:MAG TPA: esterase-like activity of phytase family protein [Chthoniobacterales bacterium]
MKRVLPLSGVVSPGSSAFAMAIVCAVFGLTGFRTCAADKLEARAVLPAATFAYGPTSGQFLGGMPVNGQAVPFDKKQPVQGFSAVLNMGDETFSVMSDNGFGSIENSADYHLRVHRIRPHFETKAGGRGNIEVLGFIELRDPDHKVPFAIVNHFSRERVLTGADFDPESMQKATDGTLWFGDEFGPFLLHTDATGRVLEAPIPLPDFDNPGREIRSPQNPYNEESATLRVMNAVRAHARACGSTKTPVFSPWEVMLDDKDPATFVENRHTVPAGSGLEVASSEIHNVASLKIAGFATVPYTVNSKPRMLELMKLGVSGIISDRPDLLREAVQEFDANNDGTPGDFISAEGLIDRAKFDAQGHRGGRNLRPENTIPAFEVALDNLMTTLEMDSGISKDGLPIISHDSYILSEKARRRDGAPYAAANEVLIRDLTAAEIQATYINDKLFRGPTQQHDPSLSPVSVAFFGGDTSQIYILPTLQQVFDFVKFYVAYYKTGPGTGHPDAARRWKNAVAIRYNIETKLNPRTDRNPKGVPYADETYGPPVFVAKIAGIILAKGLVDAADIQSFDFRTLLLSQRWFPKIRTVCLFGDFPKYTDPAIDGSDDGTNMQPQDGPGSSSLADSGWSALDDFGGGWGPGPGSHEPNTPWMAGLQWPYRRTALTHPFRASTSGGFEGMAMTLNREKLLPLLEKPLAESDANTLLIHEFDIAKREFTGVRYKYPLDTRGTNIGDFIMFSRTKGLVIERDGSQGDLNGFKAIFEVSMPATPREPIQKRLAVDLLKIDDPHGISAPSEPGDVGLGKDFSFPFVTIEDVLFFDEKHIGVLNDNNYPFSIGRHAGSRQPDDNEFIILKLDQPLGK